MNFIKYNFALFIFAIIFCTIQSSEKANKKLKDCCSKLLDLGDDKDCINRFCDFDAISQANVLNYLSTCSKRGDTVGHMWDCASSRVDHVNCCESKGVTGKCLKYCAAKNGVPTNYAEYTFCLESFNEIRDCFVEHLEKEN